MFGGKGMGRIMKHAAIFVALIVVVGFLGWAGGCVLEHQQWEALHYTTRMRCDNCGRVNSTALERGKKMIGTDVGCPNCGFVVRLGWRGGYLFGELLPKGG